MNVGLILFNNGNTPASNAFQAVVSNPPANLEGIIECDVNGEYGCPVDPASVGITRFPALLWMQYDESGNASKLDVWYNLNSLTTSSIISRINALDNTDATAPGGGGIIPVGDPNGNGLGFGLGLDLPAWAWLAIAAALGFKAYTSKKQAPQMTFGGLAAIALMNGLKK